MRKHSLHTEKRGAHKLTYIVLHDTDEILANFQNLLVCRNQIDFQHSEYRHIYRKNKRGISIRKNIKIVVKLVKYLIACTNIVYRIEINNLNTKLYSKRKIAIEIETEEEDEATKSKIKIGFFPKPVPFT